MPAQVDEPVVVDVGHDAQFALERIEKDKLPVIRAQLLAMPRQLVRHVRQHRPHPVVLRDRAPGQFEFHPGAGRHTLHHVADAIAIAIVSHNERGAAQATAPSRSHAVMFSSSALNSSTAVASMLMYSSSRSTVTISGGSFGQ